MTKVILGDRVSSYKVLAVYALLFLNSAAAFSADKLIALTFDDGPRPYVLFGTKDHAGSSLLNVLDDNGVKATFFVVGWRLTPKTWGEPRHEENVGITCIDAAEQVVRRGHELEDHTYSHIELRGAERKRGEQWVIGDVNRGADAIKAVTGTQPHYLRPPDWIISDDARRDLERQGYHLLTISQQNPIADGGLQQVPDVAQDFVSHQVAVTVVDVLETVHVADGHHSLERRRLLQATRQRRLVQQIGRASCR